MDGESRTRRPVVEATIDPNAMSDSSRARGALGPVETAPELTELALSGVAELEGTARTVDGTPVAGCRVRLTTTERAAVGFARTDQDGDFRFEDLAPGGGYRLRVTAAADDEEEVVALVLEPGPQHIDVVLPDKGVGRLRLQLINTRGEPVKNRILAARGAADAARTRGVTDPEGRLGLEAVPSGGVVIETLEPPRMTVSGLVVNPDEELEVVLIAALGADSVDGVVVDAGGATLVGVRVTASWTRRGGGLRTSVVHTVRTDGAGRFSVQGLGEGNFEISAVAAGHQRAVVTVQVPVDEPVRLELPPLR